jgi:hypothetical protein
LGNALFGCFALLLGIMLQVCCFGAKAYKLEVQKIGGLYHSAQGYVVCAKYFYPATLFYLFKVAQARAGLAFAYGKGTVGKVYQHFTALQVVTGNGLGRVTLGGMRQH